MTFHALPTPNGSVVPVQPAAVELLAALALVVYGVTGLSADVDVTLALVPDAPEDFARDMLAAGSSLRVSESSAGG